MQEWVSPPLEGRLSLSGQPVFVGRRGELEKLEAAWEAVLTGARQAVFVGGEPGAGKSRLVAEAAQAMRDDGAAVLYGASQADFGVPYQEFVEAFDHLLLATEEGTLADVLPASASELLRLTPNVRRHRPLLDDPPPAQKYRRELFDAVVDVTRALCVDRPVVLVLEDFHWARAPGRRLLAHLIEHSARDRLLVLVTHRTTEPDRSDEVTFAIADLYRLSGVTRLDLAGLSTDEIATYLVGEGSLDVPAARVSAAVLRDQTGGNPFFLREVWRDLASKEGVPGARASIPPPPTTIRDTLGRRFRNVSAEQRDVIDLAAILGRTFDLALLLEASSHDGTTTLDAVDAAERYGLVTRAPHSDSYVFVHALVRQFCLDRMSQARRLPFHATAAQAIERRLSQNAQLLPQIAFHYSKAAPLGYGELATRYSVASAQLAERSFAHEEAAAWFEAAAEMTVAGGHDREDLLFRAAENRIRGGDFAQARRIYEGLTASTDPDIRLRAAAGFEEASWRPGRHGHRALELLDRALGSVDPDPTNAHYVRALARQARAFAFAGDSASADRLGTQALELARRLGDDVLVADTLAAAIREVISPSRAATNYQRAVELWAIAERHDLIDHLGPAATSQRFITYMGGQTERWHAAHESVKRTARRTGEPFWMWVAGCGDHVASFIAGDFIAAGRVADELLEVGRSFGSDDTEGPHGMQTFMVRRETGALENVRSLVMGDEDLRTVWAPGMVALYTELEMVEAAQRALDFTVRRLGRGHEQTAEWPGVLAFLTEAAFFLRDKEAARRLRPHVAEYSGYNLMLGHSVAVFGSANRYLGLLDRLLDEPTARDNFETALKVDTQTGSVVHQAETLARYADYLDGSDDPQAAEQRLRARELAEPIGHRRVLRMLDRSEASADAPSGLSAREVDVLRQLARGLSNREIGQELFISGHTAANHVRSILMKTATANRTQAAIFAADHGLLD